MGRREREDGSRQSLVPKLRPIFNQVRPRGPDCLGCGKEIRVRGARNGWMHPECEGLHSMTPVEFLLLHRDWYEERDHGRWQHLYEEATAVYMPPLDQV